MDRANTSPLPGSSINPLTSDGFCLARQNKEKREKKKLQPAWSESTALPEHALFGVAHPDKNSLPLWLFTLSRAIAAALAQRDASGSIQFADFFSLSLFFFFFEGLSSSAAVQNVLLCAPAVKPAGFVHNTGRGALNWEEQLVSVGGCFHSVDGREKVF